MLIWCISRLDEVAELAQWVPSNG